jgi:hypothetical protein
VPGRISFYAELGRAAHRSYLCLERYTLRFKVAYAVLTSTHSKSTVGDGQLGARAHCVLARKEPSGFGKHQIWVTRAFHLPREHFDLPREYFDVAPEHFHLAPEHFHLAPEHFHLVREHFIWFAKQEFELAMINNLVPEHSRLAREHF